MIVLKDASVIYQGLCGEMMYALGVAAALKKQMFGVNCVVTSLLDGHHNDGSLHPSGRAADLRSSDLKPIEQLAWFQVIKDELEPLGFDCVPEKVESTPETTSQHLHVEWDPRGRTFWHQL